MVTTKFRTHPGEVLLLDFIKPRGLTPTQVAEDTGISRRRLGEIVDGRRPLTAETSLRLGRYFGISERFWLRLQLDYDVTMERSRLGSRLRKEVIVYEETR
jgi:antitoxin HigA-1